MKIYLDKYHLKPYSKETLEVVDEKSYVKARQEILSFFLNGKANFKSLHLYKSPYTKWFNDLSEWIEIISPKGLLKKKYTNIHLPTNLSDDDIVEMGLIDINIEPMEKEIINHFLGQSLPSNLSKIENLYIFSRIVIEKKECFNKKYVLKVWEENFKLLSENIDNHLISISKPITTLDLDFCSIISEGVYCRKDSVYIENWLHENNQVFRKYDINTKYLKNLLTDSSIIDISNEQFEKKILNFCTNRLIKKEALWSNLSGYYNAEIKAILSLKPILTQENVDFLFTKYDEILTYEQKYLLTKLIIPTLKSVPLVEGLLFAEQVEKWQNWAINSFIPYKFYLDNQPSELIKDELPKIEEASECYSDWLFDNFNTIYRKDSITTNLDVIIKINEVLEQKNSKIIWLIIDGFPAFYQPMLESILKENGINRTKTDWSFAVLPTITEVCIPTMLSRKFESDITKETTRNQLLVTASNHRKCTYTNKISDFRQNISADVDIACIHTTQIDTHLHKSDSEFEDGRENEIKSILKKRIEQISEVIKSSTERPIKLIISTDHGATKCLENGKNIKNSKLSEAAKENPRERCFKLNGKIKKENIDASEMYLLTKEVSRNIDDWAIARGYRYFGKNDSGYRHGGLSPEETIVPIMFCEISNIEPEIIPIKYLGIKELEFGKTEKDFIIQITNTNATKIELIEVSISEDKNCIFELPQKISSNDSLSLRSSIKLPQKLKQKSKNGELDLSIIIKYSLLGEPVEQKYILNVLTEKDEFGDLDF